MINLCCCGLQGCPGQVQRAILRKDESGVYLNADNKYAPIFAINASGAFSSGDLNKFSEIEFLTGNYNLVVTGQLSDNSSQITPSRFGQRWKATSTGSNVSSSHPSGFSFIIQSGNFQGEDMCQFDSFFNFTPQAVLGGSEELSFLYHRRNIILEYNSQGDATIPGTDIQDCSTPGRGCPPKQAPPSTALALFLLHFGNPGPIFPRSLYGGKFIYSGSGPCAVAAINNDICGGTNLSSLIRSYAAPNFASFSISNIFWTCDTFRDRCYSTLSGSAVEPFISLVEGEIPLGIKMKFNKAGIIRNEDALTNVVFTINGSKPLYGRNPGTSCEVNPENAITGFIGEVISFASGEEITIDAMNFLVSLGGSGPSGMAEVSCGILQRAATFHAAANFSGEFLSYSSLPATEQQALERVAVSSNGQLAKNGRLKIIFD